MDSLSEVEKTKATELTGLGLPEAAAVNCAKAITAGSTATGMPCRIYGVMKMKEGGDEAAVLAALKEYGAASRAAPGNLGCDYGFSNGQLTMFETFESKNAMDIRTFATFSFFFFCFAQLIFFFSFAAR